MTRHLPALFLSTVLLAACSQEPQPRTVTEFIDNPLLLEAAMVRCSKDRTKSKYEPECINAREAVKMIQAKEEAERRADLEARSEEKRRALRRTQEATAEAQRRAAEARRQQEEAEYLAQFGVLPPSDGAADEEMPEGNVPQAVVPDQEDKASESGESGVYGDTLPASDGGNAPTAVNEPAVEPED